MMPIRWMAPESIVDGKYSVKSDVWAFGVVMWEIFSGGVTPYSRLGNTQVIETVLSGKRLLPPDNSPPLMRTMMFDCFQTDPADRPSFDELHSMLHTINTRRARGSLDMGLMLPEEIQKPNKRSSLASVRSAVSRKKSYQVLDNMVSSTMGVRVLCVFVVCVYVRACVYT